MTLIGRMNVLQYAPWRSFATVVVWNIDTGVCGMTLADIFCEKELTHRNITVRVVIQLSDGRLSSGSYDNTIELWNISTYICERTLSGHTTVVLSLVELFDGRLCSGSEDGTIRLWNIDNGVCVQKLTGHTDIVKSLLQLCNDGIIKWSP